MVNQGQSHTASATTGAAPPGGEGTTRGGVRRGSVASSAVSSANPTPVREGALAAMASDGAVAHDGLNSGQQSPHPLRNTDGSGIFSAGAFLPFFGGITAWEASRHSKGRSQSLYRAWLYSCFVARDVTRTCYDDDGSYRARMRM